MAHWAAQRPGAIPGCGLPLLVIPTHRPSACDPSRNISCPSTRTGIAARRRQRLCAAGGLCTAAPGGAGALCCEDLKSSTCRRLPRPFGPQNVHQAHSARTCWPRRAGMRPQAAAARDPARRVGGRRRARRAAAAAGRLRGAVRGGGGAAGMRCPHALDAGEPMRRLLACWLARRSAALPALGLGAGVRPPAESAHAPHS